MLDDWWKSVDNPTLVGDLGEPLSVYRIQWSHEQRVMQDYLWQSAKHGKRIVVASRVSDFNSASGVYPSHYWFKNKGFSDAERRFLKHSLQNHSLSGKRSRQQKLDETFFQG